MFVVSTQAYNVSLTSIEQQFSQIEKQLISCNAKLESEQKKHEEFISGVSNGISGRHARKKKTNRRVKNT